MGMENTDEMNKHVSSRYIVLTNYDLDVETQDTRAVYKRYWSFVHKNIELVH